MVPELLEGCVSRLLNDLHEFTRQQHGRSLPFEPEFSLEIPHNMAEVNMKQLSFRIKQKSSIIAGYQNIDKLYLTIFLEHDIIVVSVPYAEDVHGHRVPTAGQHEPLQGLLQVPGLRVVPLQPGVDQVLLEGRRRLLHPSRIKSSETFRGELVH